MKSWTEKSLALLRATLVAKSELNEIDWKQAESANKARLTQHLSAFGNYPGGGVLAFGITPTGGVKGVSDDELSSMVNTLANLGRVAVEPPLQLDHECADIEGVRILLVRIPESIEKPVHLRGRPLDDCYIRTGATTRKASRAEVGMLMTQSKNRTWEGLHATPLLEEPALLQKLNVGPIFELLNQPLPGTREELLRWLENERFIERAPAGGGYITNLGAVSAAEPVSEFEAIARHAVRVIEYKGQNKTAPVTRRDGGKGYAIGFKGLLAYIMRRLPANEVIVGAIRQSVPSYPEIAIRELLANALIHQDFSISGTSPLVEIYEDRIDITSPGGLLPSKEINRLIGTQPESRNERLAKAFRRYGICEEQGSGLVKTIAALELHGLPPLGMDAGENYFKVTVFAARTYAEMTQHERISACYQHAVLKYHSNSVMTNKSLRERLKMPEKRRSMVSVLIQETLDSGLIKAADPENKSRKFSEYLPYYA